MCHHSCDRWGDAPLTFTRIRKKSLSDVIVEQLKGMIIRKELVRGQRLPSEQELAESFGVGRHTVREALKELEILGLVESRVGQGSFITEVNPKDVLDFMTNQLVMSRSDMVNLMELRRILEINIAFLAAQRANEENLEEIRSRLSRMESYKDDPEKFVEEDVSWHFAVAKATGNEYFGVVLNAIHNMLLSVQKEVVYAEGAAERALEYHRLIYEAIRGKKPTEAQALMNDHMESTYQTLITRGAGD